MKPEVEVKLIKDIKIPDSRQRKEFKGNDIEDLANSIKSFGLIHAIVLDEHSNLVAGERRLRAAAFLEEKKHNYTYAGFNIDPGEIPTIILHDLDKQTLFAIELEENLRRVNLTHMEEAQAIAKLHNLRKEFNPQQTMKETAKEVAKIENRESTTYDESKVAMSMLVDQFSGDPEIETAAKTSLNKAAKLAKKKLELSLVQALEESKPNEEFSRNNKFTVIHADLTEVIEDFPEAHFDAMIFDPPYGIDANKFNEQAFGLGHQYSDEQAFVKNLLTKILLAGKTILNADSHILMFCAYPMFNQWVELYENLGYWVWPRPLIWDKGNQAHAPIPGRGPRNSYECILFAGKGKRNVNKTINDVLRVNGVTDKLHAAEKPVELLTQLIDFVCTPGDRILDPTCGSGSIFSAGRDKEIYITGIELDAAYAALAKERAEL